MPLGNVWSLFAPKSSSGVAESIHCPMEFSGQFPQQFRFSQPGGKKEFVVKTKTGVEKQKTEKYYLG